ncbi:hypothetical protein Btru_075203 [Bulinus truncatus]|nr:hypothetical protein Btru_075203 [Bulinus truncatus]
MYAVREVNLFSFAPNHIISRRTICVAVCVEPLTPPLSCAEYDIPKYLIGLMSLLLHIFHTEAAHVTMTRIRDTNARRSWHTKRHTLPESIKEKLLNSHDSSHKDYNNNSSDSSALDERLNDIERRGRSRKKRRSPPLKPMLKRAASTPSKIPCQYESCTPDYQYKSVRFQNHPYSCHVSGVSPPPCHGKDTLRKLTSDSCRYTPASRSTSSIPTSAGDTICSGMKHYDNYGSYSKSVNNNYTCVNSAPSFKLYSSDNPTGKYGVYSDYDKGGEPRNWKLALKLDELMLKYNEFNIPSSKSFKANGSPYPIGLTDTKHSYVDLTRNASSSWKQDTPSLSRKTYTSPYKDYVPSNSFSKYASFYGDGSGMTPSASAASTGFNPYGGGGSSYRTDPYKSPNDNRSAYAGDSTDWGPSKIISSEVDLRSKRGKALDSGLKRTPYGLDSSNNKYMPSCGPTKFNDDLKFVSGTTLSYDLSKYKSELFSSGSLLNNQNSESKRVATMLSEYQRMDYYRKTMQDQRQKNLELLEKYVLRPPRNKTTEFMCNKNENRKNFDVVNSGSTLDEKIFHSLKNKYDPPIGMGKYKSMRNSLSAENLPVMTRSRSLSSGAVDHRRLTGATSVADMTLDRWPKSNKYICRGTSADDVRAYYLPNGVDTSSLRDPVSRRSKTPDDYLTRSTAGLSREYRRRSPSIDTDTLLQSYSSLKYGSNRNRNYSPSTHKTDYMDTVTSEGAYVSNGSKAKMSTPGDYSSSISRESKPIGHSSNNDYSSSDYSSMYMYGLKSDKNSFLNDTNNWTGKSPGTLTGSKKCETNSPSFYLGGRALRDFSTNAKQDNGAKGDLHGEDADYFSSVSRVKKPECSPRTNAAAGMPEEKFMSTNIASKIPPVSYSCKHVINLCLDDETNRLKNINSLIKKTTNLNSSSNNHTSEASRAEVQNEL